MALIKCTECNNEVSDRAESCPKCGNPINPELATPADISKNKTEDKPKKKTGCVTWVAHILSIV